jgi:hypothetical protein
MSIVIVHDPLTAQLAAATSPIEICSPEGQLLGYFTPVKPQQLTLDPGVSDEEIERRFANGGGRSLNAILVDLEKRA